MTNFEIIRNDKRLLYEYIRSSHPRGPTLSNNKETLILIISSFSHTNIETHKKRTKHGHLGFILRCRPCRAYNYEIGLHAQRRGFSGIDDRAIPTVFEKEGYTDEKVYALLPNNPQHYVTSDFNELNICTESDIATMKRVENYCSKSDCTFSSDREKLAYVASLMPDVFSKDTPFEYAHQTHLKIAHINSQIDYNQKNNIND